MNDQYYNQNYTKEEVDAILNMIQNCIREGNYHIALNENRQENINFIENYRLSPQKRKDILLQIKTEDFCHSLANTKIGFEHEILYVFCPNVVLYNIKDEREIVDVYTKFNILDIDDNKKVVVISLHKRNKPLKYLFR